MALREDDEHRLDVGPAFLWAAILNTGYVLVEALFGFWIESLALLADSADNLIDVFGLLAAWGAFVVRRRRPTKWHTYGLGRATILAALANGIALLIGVGVLVREAIERIFAPEPVAATTILWGGNNRDRDQIRDRPVILERTLLGHQRRRRVPAHGRGRGRIRRYRRLRAHYRLHHWTIVNQIVAIIVSAVIGWSAFGRSKSAIHLSVDGTPEGSDLTAIEAWLRALPGVCALSTTSNALTIHLLIPDGFPNDVFFEQTACDLECRFGIAHATLQVERKTETECRLSDSARP